MSVQCLAIIGDPLMSNKSMLHYGKHIQNVKQIITYIKGSSRFIFLTNYIMAVAFLLLSAVQL